MKQLFKSVMLFAAAAMAFTACSDNEDSVIAPVEEGENLTFSVEANIESQTRADFENGNNSQMTWREGDRIRVNYTSTADRPNQIDLDFDVKTRKFINKNNDFMRRIKVGSEMHAATMTPGKDGNFVGIPAVQENSYNGVYFNLKNVPFEAAPVVFESSMQVENEINAAFNFKHIASYMQIRFVTEVPEMVGKQIKMVKFEAVGAANEGGDFVQVDFPTDCPTIVDKAAAKDYNNVAYLMIVPGTYTGNFMVETTTGDVVTIPVTDKTFKRANVHRIALNIKPSAQKQEMYVRLTAANSSELLVDGAEFVILGSPEKSKSYVSNEFGTTWLGAEKPKFKELATGISSDFVAVEDVADARVFKLMTPTTAGEGWWIESKGKYMESQSENSYFVMNDLGQVNDMDYHFKVWVDGDKTKIEALGNNKGKWANIKQGYIGNTRRDNHISIFVKSAK